MSELEIMKIISISALLILVLSESGSITMCAGQFGNGPCRGAQSNAEARACYAQEQLRVNSQVESLTKVIASNLRKVSLVDPSDTIEDGLLKMAASKVEKSQIEWKAYCAEYCAAVEASWTTGSGGGTANERCMFELGHSRLEQLKSDFDAWSQKQPGHERP